MTGVADLAVRLGGRQVLYGVTFAARPGEFCAVCGPNGAGKTTLLRALAGLIPPSVPMPREVAYVEQGARSAWDVAAEDLVRLGRLPHGDRAKAPVERAMTACGVLALRQRRMRALSGGQARRVMLARALATEAPVLLLDEPTSDLDPRAAHEIMALLAGQARAGRAVVAVLHAVELAVAHADRMVVMREGCIVADGAPASVMPAAAAAFGMTVGLGPRLLMPEEETWSA